MSQRVLETSTGVLVELGEEPIRVLHVDDDYGFLKAAKQCLELEGDFQVDTASSVEEALEKMKEKTFDAVVSDYRMLGKDGLEFLKELRGSGNMVPFIIFTGKGEEKVAIEALNLGADRYFNKTDDPETLYCDLAHGIRRAVERRRALIEVWEKEERLRAVFTSSPDAIVVCDLAGNIVDCNEAALELAGSPSKAELIGKSSLDFIAEKDRRRALKNVNKTVMRGTTKGNEYTLLTSEGKEYLGEISASLLRDSSDTVTGFVAILRDITKRRKN